MVELDIVLTGTLNVWVHEEPMLIKRIDKRNQPAQSPRVDQIAMMCPRRRVNRRNRKLTAAFEKRRTTR